MSIYKGTANTIGELLALLADYPTDMPIRLKTISHEFPPAALLGAPCPS